MQRGFTLVELLVVLVIVGLVSVLAIPMALHAYGERGIQEGARLVHAAIVAARDSAAGTGSAQGIRFMPDPVLPGTCARLVPIGPAPDYSSGLVTITDLSTLPAGFTLPYPCLMLEQSSFDRSGIVTEPTSWPYNVRVGDRVNIGGAGPWYTVVGPTDPANPTAEGFVTPVQALDRGDGRGPLDYLWLANELDDDGDGFVDNGWDGVDNNNNGSIDEPAEWEIERWRQPAVTAAPYLVRRRPVPIGPTRSVDLPAGVVIDTTGLPGEILIDATGTVTSSGPYTVPSRIGLASHELRIHLIERGPSGHDAWVVVNTRTGQIETETQ